MNQGVYEELVTQLVENKLSRLNQEEFYIKKSLLYKAEASTFLSKHLAQSIKVALSTIKGEHQVEKQIEIAKKYPSRKSVAFIFYEINELLS